MEPELIEAPLPDRLLLRDELAGVCHVSSATLSRWMREGKLPPPDVAITRKAQQWRLSSLHRAGIMI